MGEPRVILGKSEEHELAYNYFGFFREVDRGLAVCPSS